MAQMLQVTTEQETLGSRDGAEILRGLVSFAESRSRNQKSHLQASLLCPTLHNSQEGSRALLLEEESSPEQ